MKRFFKRTLATVLVVLMLLTSGPLQGFVDLELPDWFSGKASALRMQLTAEEAVDIYMANRSVWKFNEYYATPHDYFFIDLDFDNVLELGMTYMYGTGFFSTNRIYKINPVTKKVYEVTSEITNNLDFHFSGDAALKLYETSEGMKFYLTEDLFRGGYAYNETVEKGIFYKNNVISYKNLYGIANKTDSNYNTTKHYYVPTSDGKLKEVPYNTYVTTRDAFYKSCVDLHLRCSSVEGQVFDSDKEEVKREKLLEMYKYFYYDGMGEMRFIKHSADVYLGSKNNSIPDYNDIVFAYEPVKGGVHRFDASKLKFVIEDESIAEVAKVMTHKTGANLTETFVELKTNYIGETKITAIYDGQEIDECIIKVDYPNGLKIEMPELGMEMYEIDGVFFNSSGSTSVGSIKLPIEIKNTFLEDVSFTLDKRPEILELLKLKNIRLSFEIKGSDVLSFSNNKMEKKLDLQRDVLEFEESSEPEEFEVYIFSENPNRFLVDDIDNVEIVCSVYFSHPTDEGVDAYNPEADEKREARETICDTFDMLSYKNKYVEDHKRAMDPYTHARMLYDFSLSESLIKLEDELEYKFYQGIEKSLLENITDVVVDFDEIIAYDIMIADLISMYNGDDGALYAAFKSEYSNSFLDNSQKILDKFLRIAENMFEEPVVKELKKVSLTDVNNLLIGKGNSGLLNSCFQQVMMKSNFLTMLDNTIFVSDKINTVLEEYGFFVNSVENLGKALKIYSALQAFDTMTENQKVVLKGMQSNALKKGNFALASAISDFLIHDNSLLDSMAIESCVQLVLALDATSDKILGEMSNIIKDSVRSQLTNVVGLKLFGAGSVYIAAATAGFEVGKLLSDSLCNYKDFSAACTKIISAGKVSEVLRPVIQQTYYDLLIENELEAAYEKARAFDFAFSMYKQLEYIASDATKTALEAKDNAPLMYFLNDAKKEGREKIAELTTKLTSIEKTYCHDEYLESVYSKICYYTSEYGSVGDDFASGFNDYKTICVQCPVDVIVRNSNGQVVASVENNVATNKASGVGIIVIGDEKYICLPATEEYDVKLIATDSGAMDYAVFEFGGNLSESVRGVTYDNIALTKDKEFTAKLDTELLADARRYNITTGTQTIAATKDDYVPVTAVTLTGNTNIFIGNETTLTVTATPENARPASFNWVSSDESIATVYGGVVKGLKAGTVTVTCQAKNDSSVKASVEVTVSECAHSYSEWETVEESTCSMPGMRRRSCSVCNTFETEKIAELKSHTPSAESVEFSATCTKNAATVTFCTLCGEVCSKVEKQGTAKGHKPGAVTVDKKASMENHGSCSQTCSTCGSKVNVTKIPRIIPPSLSQTEFIYDGKKKAPTLTVYDYNGKQLTVNTDYKLAVDSGRVKPGIYNVKVTFIGKYEGAKNLSYKIRMKDITLKATSSSSSIRLDWSSVTGATGYAVYYKVGTGWKAIGTTSGLTATFKKLPAGRKYTFAVRAGAVLNGETIWADSYATVDTATQAVKPAKVAAAQNKNAIKLTWSACAGATGYRIYYKSGSTWKICVDATAATSHTFKNLKPGAKYTFAIRPYVLNGKSVIWSDYTQFMTATRPEDVKVSVANYSNIRMLQIDWPAIEGVDGYQLYYKKGNGAYKLYNTYATPQNLFISSPAGSATYTFAVRAGIRTSGGIVWGGFIEKTVNIT